MTGGLRVFAAPTHYRQGPGALDTLGDIIAPYGATPLIVTDPPVHSMLAARLEASFSAAGLRPTYGLLTGEITYAALDRLIAAHAADDVSIVVGIGGGKALDAAKGVALRLALPVVTVPTIASNDSPASGAIAMYDDTHSLISVDRLPQHPVAVVVDTELIACAPAAFLRSGIGDAISKRFEARGCWAGTGLTPLGTRPLLTAGYIADACYDTIRAHGVAAMRACVDQKVTDDLEAVVEAVVLMSGLGFENGGLSLAHAMTRGLMRARGVASTMHGLQVAWGLLVQLATVGEPASVITDLMSFYRDLGLPVSLAELGLTAATPAEIDGIVSLSLAAPHVLNLPGTVDAATVAAAMATVERLARQSVGSQHNSGSKP